MTRISFQSVNLIPIPGIVNASEQSCFTGIIDNTGSTHPNSTVGRPINAAVIEQELKETLCGKLADEVNLRLRGQAPAPGRETVLLEGRTAILGIFHIKITELNTAEF